MFERPLMMRVQRRRARGWRLPENCVCVSRGTRFGNPFKVGDPGVPDNLTAVRLYDEALLAGQFDYTVQDVVSELAGRAVACWCGLDESCHADVLRYYAAGSAPALDSPERAARMGVRVAGFSVIEVNDLPPVDVCERTIATLARNLQQLAQKCGLELCVNLHRSTVPPPRGRMEIRNALTGLVAAVGIAHAELGQPATLTNPAENLPLFNGIIERHLHTHENHPTTEP